MLWNFMSRDSIFGPPFLKPHIVSEELVHCLCNSLIKRGISEIGWKRVSSTALDPGGAIWLDRHVFTFDIDDLKINCAAVDMSLYFNLIQDLEPRDDADVEYYKIHGNWNALVLSEDQREQLLVLMSAEMPVARAIAEAEMQYFKKTSEEMQEKNAIIVDFNKWKEGKGLK